MENQRLGVHIIARNEEDFLPQCLDSVHDLADELIVVDTGSSDRTVHIAESYGAKVISMDWENDFSQARNQALSCANTEWVLYLDADEVLAEGKELIPGLLADTDAEAFWIEMENRVGHRPEERVLSRAVRLFRLRDAYRFRGRIHEEIASAILERNAPSKIRNSSLRLVHYGYMPAVMKKKNKADRNLDILKDLLAQFPDDPFHTYNLGVTYCQLDRLEQAIQYMEKARQNTPMGAAYRPTLIRDSAKIYLELNQEEKAEHVLREEIANYPDYPDLHHLLGQSLEPLGRFEEAFRAYQTATDCAGSDKAKYVTEYGTNTFRSLNAMAEIAKKLGNMAEASGLYRQALAHHIRYEPAWEGWADLLCLTGHSDDAILEHFRSVMQSSNAEDTFLLAQLMAGIGAYPESLTLLRGMEHQLSMEGKRLKCECLLQTGLFIEAYGQLSKLLEQADEAAALSFIQDQALCRWSEERTLPLPAVEKLPPESQEAFRQIDRWISQNDLALHLDSDPSAVKLASDIMDRTVQLKLLRVAKKLAGISPELSLSFAKSLYRHGFVLMAADRLLECMQEGSMDTDGLYILAEIVYRKGHFRQASLLFEQVLQQTPEHERARTGASLCYLHLASEVLLDGLTRFPNHPLLQSDWQRIEAGKTYLERTNWLTSWHAAQRRNSHAADIDFALYDRQR